MPQLRLTIEPIPVTSRLATLARLMPAWHWSRIRRSVYSRAGCRCRVCARRARLDCHEVWQYNERTGYQWLRGLQALCRDCHDAKHILFIHDNNRRRARLLQHFMAVNHLNQQQADGCLEAARHRQHRLDQRHWIISYGRYNWSVPPPKTAGQRLLYPRSPNQGSP